MKITSAVQRGTRSAQMPVIVEAFLALVLCLAVGAAGSLVLALLVMLLSAPAQAAAAESRALGPAMEKGEVTRGTLLLRGEDRRYHPAPTVETDVRMSITGMVARVHVSQRFHNPSTQWVEGVYVFPLPDNAAVDGMRMRVGERVLEGKIMERKAARRTYTKAKRAGKKAVLTEQERPNIFTNSVANIGPGEDVHVEIDYQQTLRYDQGVFRLRFPMVVGPRYIPGEPLEAQVSGFEGTGWARNTDQVPDASRITPPVLHPDKGPRNPVRLQVDLEPGFPLARLTSSHHTIKTTRLGDHHVITLDADSVPADRDFELVWAPDVRHAPRAALFTQREGEDSYLLLMIMPPAAERAQRLPREVIYVIDTSGSMGGASIRQAKAALRLALERLRPGDRFNVIQFNSRTHTLFSSARDWNAQNRARAIDYVNGLRAGGGTEMASALRAALDGAEHRSRVRQVIFLTDGSVGNERGLFDLITKRLGDSRLFTVGIGSAPNGFFMRRAAGFGRGTFTHIGSVQQVQTRMAELFRKLESPVLTDVRVKWPEDAAAEMWPRHVPDLYAGEPVVLRARVKALHGTVTVSGTRAGASWERRLVLKGGAGEKGIGKLWARAKIASLMDSLHEGADRGEVRKQVIAVALRHHLVSRYTSLVAVDVTPTRPDNATAGKRNVPLNLPHGWKYEKVFGGLPQTATPARLHAIIGLLALLLGLLAMRWSTARRARPVATGARP